MKKLTLKTREIGAVSIFDLEGVPTPDTLEEVAAKMQKKIRRHRLQRVILNLQNMPALDLLGTRKLLAACLRPKQSLIYGASVETVQSIRESYHQQNIRICEDIKEIADDFGPFLMEKGRDKEVPLENPADNIESIGQKVERRRSKRMHVAMPVHLKLKIGDENVISTNAIITNISEGGIFCEYLDLEDAKIVDKLENIEGLNVDIKIYPCENFPEEYYLQGLILRKEVRKKQLGVAIKFLQQEK